MGVAGSGKTRIGQQLAAQLGWQFIDADDLHSVSNVEKMVAGVPLTDRDREPWLGALRSALAGLQAEGRDVVLA